MTAQESEPLNVVIRPPQEAEWPACRMLLPEAFARGESPECLLAVSEAPRQMLGASSFKLAERMAAETLSLPMFPGITERQIGRVAGAIREFEAGR